jgi:uncharacterized protein DUF2735
MTTDNDRGSAKIYQFPPRGRFASGNDKNARSGLLVSPMVKTTACGSSWYHDEAIRDDLERDK